jgi:Uma2 family endonuclease
MQVTLPDDVLPATLILNPERRLSDDEYFDLRASNPDLRLERTSSGEIVIVPPGGMESSFRNAEVSGQVREWARKSGRGKTLESSVAFTLPDGSALCPDAAWVSDEQLASLPKGQRRKFPNVCPAFVVEVMSPTDRLHAQQRKMQQWMKNGAQLGWLIDGDARTVYIYRPGQPVEKRTDLLELAGEGPVEGFVLDLREIWAGL